MPVPCPLSRTVPTITASSAARPQTAVPANSGTVGRTETFIGNWMKARENRSDLVLATKVCGPGYNWIAGNRSDPKSEEQQTCVLDRESIFKAIEGSLRRLQTDYVDLYQIHWPQRYAPRFGTSVFNKSKWSAPPVDFEEQVQAMGDLIKAGKIRHWGLSNETAYGTILMCETAKRLGVPLPVSIQNDFSLLKRDDETALAEALFHYGVEALPYGPLAGGTLSGKYHDDDADNPALANCRHRKFPNFQPRYYAAPAMAAAGKYVQVAKDHGLTPVQLALAWCDSRWYVGSTIIGACSVAQLEECASAWGVPRLSQGCLDAVDVVHRQARNPVLTD